MLLNYRAHSLKIKYQQWSLRS
ncbi:protein of unknown function (plasmid) [Caballeronia sp. S22]